MIFHSIQEAVSMMLNDIFVDIFFGWGLFCKYFIHKIAISLFVLFISYPDANSKKCILDFFIR